MCKILTNERKIEIRRNNSPLREINTGIEMCFPCQSGSKALKSAVENPNIKKKKIPTSVGSWKPCLQITAREIRMTCLFVIAIIDTEPIY